MGDRLKERLRHTSAVLAKEVVRVPKIAVL